MNKRSFKQFLNEAPLPDDWDDALYDPRVPFAKRIRYAQERAAKVGSGSSRVAFVIPYEGRKTILKIAKNKKGVAQNSEEAALLSDWYIRNLGITIPIIDYDEKNEEPTWIHTEFANKIKDSDFKKLTGMPLYALINYCELLSGRKKGNLEAYKSYYNIDEDNEFINNLADMIGNYTNILVGDFERLANWGLYDGRPVIIDLGLTDNVLKSHY